jgi:hypothetical protein
MYRNPDAKRSGATELPGNIFAAHHTYDFTAARGPSGGFHGRGAERRRPRLSTKRLLGSKAPQTTITRGCIRFPAADCLREIRRRTSHMTASTL